MDPWSNELKMQRQFVRFVVWISQLPGYKVQLQVDTTDMARTAHVVEQSQLKLIDID